MKKINDIKQISSHIEDSFRQAVLLRRAIHRNPELSGQEFETAALIHKYLSGIGLKPVYHLKKTAVMAAIRNGRGRHIVLRADTDALPILEKTGLPYSSLRDGVMHACGHDMHTAILLGAASVLNKTRELWKGTITLLFQPSEEVEPGGAWSLLNAGVFPDDVSAIFGLHVSTDHKSGEVGLREGTDYAGICTFDVTVKGAGAHGATPEKSVDPIVCTAALITSLQTLISRETSPFTPATLNIGTVHAGTLRNIIPDQAEFQGTLRSHSKETLKYLSGRIGEMIRQTASSFRAEAEVTFQESYPPSFNDPDMTARFGSAFSSLYGSSSVVHRPDPTMLAEDFAYYQQKVPGLYVHLGVRPSGRKFNGFGIHSAKFIPDEAAIKTGIASHITFATEMLKC